MNALWASTVGAILLGLLEPSQKNPGPYIDQDPQPRIAENPQPPLLQQSK